MSAVDQLNFVFYQVAPDTMPPITFEAQLVRGLDCLEWDLIDLVPNIKSANLRKHLQR